MDTGWNNFKYIEIHVVTCNNPILADASTAKSFNVYLITYDIAKKQNCPVGTVMSRIFYAKKEARKYLKSVYNNHELG